MVTVANTDCKASLWHVHIQGLESYMADNKQNSSYIISVLEVAVYI